MNQRIRELWDQAAESTAAYSSGQNNSWETQVNFMDKFAELIVQECAQVAHNKQYKHSPAHIVGDCSIAIKQHFGVEQ